ncbi:MAG TPA: L-threonylcarbamoyladenylate synthase [Candidatus Aminicenantes bacterium]|nr:L-threonylcarbamoyladenylate synthase [Candidatus Aminicenantes bacterium]
MIVIPLADVLSTGNLRKIVDCVRDGGVIAYPTDTLYGLGGNFLSAAAHTAVDRLKGRRGAPYSAAVGDWSMLESLVCGIPNGLRERLQGLLPGKFTFLFAPGPAVDPALLKGSAKIGVRMPGLKPLLDLIVRLGVPLISTSANRSGRPPLQDPALIAREFPDLDILIDAGALAPSRGSTVVDFTADPPAIVRPGDDEPKVRSILGGARV